jgi:hypothetical protein
MDFQTSEESLAIQEMLRTFVRHHMLPADAAWRRQAESGTTLPYYLVHGEEA